ncbi:hemagglutinin repeat-containing protein [Aquincola sp. J276]|uniref:hemagglutinin repeat-containing protein n=1 Tax=Aquincola sp. J276 TaxID=2898432 RepID=UPI002150DCCE|nr:hemagglutinin repeat-containing protein [Aquincola sp. J276]MCR5865173.1 hemagglutinin repeat-containing protein [Aquincola sp. J276]
MSVDLDGDYSNGGTLSARQDLTLRAHHIVNTGVLNAAGTLRAQSTAAITNTGEISGGNVVLDAGAHLSNVGLISSAAPGGHTRLSSPVIANTGRIYGDFIALQAGSVSNSAAGTMAARQRLDIGAGNISNSGVDALLYSLGGLSIGGLLDTSAWQATARAQSLNNTAGRIEAAGDMTLRSDAILNANSGVSTVMGAVTAGPASAYLVPDGSTRRYDLAQCSGVENRSMYATCIVRPELYGRRQNMLPIFSQSSNCDYSEAGGNCVDVITWNYTWDSDAYQRFGIARMDRPRPAEPGAGCTVSQETESAGMSVADVQSPECNHWRALTQAWDAEYHVKRDQLGAALNEYNAEVDYENEVDSVGDYTVFRVTSSVQREQIVNSEPGRILSGGSMTIDGVEITNRDSRIVAGGDLMVNGLADDDGIRAAVRNLATQGQQITTYAGTSQHSNLTEGGFGSGRRRRLDPEQPFNPAPSVITVDVETSVVVRHAAALQGGATTAIGSGYGGAAASGAGSVAGQPVDPRAVSGALPAGVERPGAAPVGAGASRIGTTHVPAWSSIESLSNDGADEAQERPSPPAEGAAQMAQSQPAPLLQRQQAWTVSRVDRRAGSVSERAPGIRQGMPPGASAAAVRAEGAAQVPVALRYEVRDASARPQAVVLTLAPRLSAPGGSLFVLNTRPAASYLVETDPAFTNYRSFLSSEHFQRQLALDPQRQHKRYGDGFSEQQLVNDQILALTGRRFLAGYGDTESEYLSLMNAGAAFGHRYQLTPGIALTGEQMALLSTDIVWLVEQDVRLPDGSTQRVLVPQVYLRRPLSGDLLPTGTLMAGGSVSVVTPGSLTNSGTLSGDWIEASAGNDLDNTGRIQATQSVLLSAERDLVNTSGSVAALAGSVDLSAGRDVVLQTRTVQTHQSAANRRGVVQSERMAADRIATIQAGQDLLVSAGRDLTVTGASLRNAEGDLQALAGRSITVSAVQGEYRLESHVTQGRSVRGRTGFVEEAHTTQVASELDAAGNLVLLAGRDSAQAAGSGGRLHLSGSTLAAQGDIRLQGDQVSIAAATASESTDIQAVGRRAFNRASSRSESVVGGSVSAQGSLLVRATGPADQGEGDVHLVGAHLSAQQGATVIEADRDVRVESMSTAQNSFAEGYRKSSSLLSSTTRTRTSREETTHVEGSVIEGQSVLVRAGQDVVVQGSQVVADQGLRIDAGRDLKVIAAQEHSEGQAASSRTKSGIFGTGGGLTAGKQQLQQASRSDATIPVGSQIGSLSGNVALVAGGAYLQTGSDVVSPAGDIDIQAEQVLIQEARETRAQSAVSRSRQSGVSFTISSPVLSALQAAQGQLQAASNTRSSRLQALAGANAALQVNAALDALAAGQGDAQGRVPTDQTSADGSAVRVDGNAADKVGGLSVSLSVGGTSSRSQQHSQADTSRGSTVVAGGDVRIRATGGGAASNVVVQGSDVVAGGRVAISADDAVRLLASQNTSTERSSNSSKSGSIGLGMSLGNAGSGSSLGITVSASTGKGEGAGNSTTFDNSRVVGASVHIESGGNTELRGAVVRGDQVSAQVGGDLVIESLQDQARYRERSRSAGGSVTFGAAPNGSAQIGATSIRSDFLSVGEQSALRAGDGGFQVEVAGRTDLTGGQITSTQAAIDAGKNRYEAQGGTTVTDLQNSASYSAKSVSVGVGAGGGSSGGRPGAGLGAVGVGTDADSARSESKAAISGVAGDVDARTGDREIGLAQLFNKEKVKAEVEAQVAITAEFGRQASTVVGKFADDKLAEANRKDVQSLNAAANGDAAIAEQLRTEAEQLRADWGSNGLLRLAAHTTIGALTGGGLGAAGAASGALTAPLVADALKSAGVDEALASGLTALVSTAAGAAVGGGAGGAAAFNEVVNNYLSKPDAVRNPQVRQRIVNAGKDCRGVASCESMVAGMEAQVALLSDDRIAAMCGADVQCVADRKDERSLYAQVRDEAASKLTPEAAATAYLIRQAISPFSKQDLAAAVTRLQSNESDPGKPVDQYVRDTLLADPAMFAAVMGVGLLDSDSGGGGKGGGRLGQTGSRAGGAKVHGSANPEAQRTIIELAASGVTRGDAAYKILNDPPPNSIVRLSNGIEFRTNEGGLVDELSYIPSLSRGVRDARQTAVGKEGLPTDVGGHIQACQFGGTCDRFNIFPQDGNFNNSAFKRWENEIKAALINGDEVGRVIVRFNRIDAFSPRPDSVRIDYEINGIIMRKFFRNEAGQ